MTRGIVLLDLAQLIFRGSMGLKKKLVSVAMLEHRGYDLIFSKGKVFLRHIATGQVKKIGIRVKDLYKLEVEDCDSLSMKAEMVQS